MTRCSSPPAALAASVQYCAGLRALKIEITEGVSKTCIYAANIMGGGPVASAYDGALVGVLLSDGASSFCARASMTMTGGQLLPAACGEPQVLCQRGSDNGETGAADAGSSDEPVQACLNAVGGSCEPCCAATPPDCSNKPDGYPGYSCTPASGTSNMPSFCACACSRGAWQCGC